VKYAFIRHNLGRFSVALMCRELNVSRAGFYNWMKRPLSQQVLHRSLVSQTVNDLFIHFEKTYGAPRITRELKEMGIKCSHNYVAQIMKEQGLRACNGKAFRYSSYASSMLNVSENLLNRNFKADAPNQKWSTDITYINVSGTWIYLAVVMDLCSRGIVGWAIDSHMTLELPMRALQMAFARRKVQKGLIVHSDRGVQYRSNEYRAMLLEYGCRISMSRKANCWDNAPVESFFSRFKVEFIYQKRFISIDQAKSEIFKYIEIFYNRKRKHSALGYVSPVQFEQLIL
jgi:putative transposase